MGIQFNPRIFSGAKEAKITFKSMRSYQGKSKLNKKVHKIMSDI